MSKKYKVKHTSIMHNGKVYAEGSVIELTDIEAKRLEDFVEILPNQESATKTKTPTATQASNTKKSENKTPAKNQSKTETKNEPETVKSDDKTQKDGESSEGGSKNDN